MEPLGRSLALILALPIWMTMGHLTEDWLRSNVFDPSLIKNYSINNDKLHTWKIHLSNSDQPLEMRCGGNGSVSTDSSTQLTCDGSSIYFLKPNRSISDQSITWSKIRIEEINKKRIHPAIYGAQFQKDSTPPSLTVAVRTSRSDTFHDQRIVIDFDFDRSNPEHNWTVIWQRLTDEKCDNVTQWLAGNSNFHSHIAVPVQSMGNYTLRVLDESGSERFRRRLEYFQISRVIYGLGTERYYKWPTTSENVEEVTNEMITNLTTRVEVPKEEFFKFGAIYLFECPFMGYPFDWDNAILIWEPMDGDCDRSKVACQRRRVIEVGRDEPNGIKLFRNRGAAAYHLRLLVNASESGRYACVYNQSGAQPRSKRLRNFLVSDAPDGSGIYAELASTSGVSISELVEGDSITLRCMANRFEYQNLTWTRSNVKSFDTGFEYDDGRIRTRRRNLRNSFVFDLIIENVTSNDSDQYFCKFHEVIDGEHYIESSKPVQIDISQKSLPHFENKTEPKQPVVHKRHAQFDFYCDAVGAPSPTIEWRKNRRSIDCDRQGIDGDRKLNLEAGGKRLVIRNAEVADGGVYSCLARNRLGASEYNFSVTVDDPLIAASASRKRDASVFWTCLVVVMSVSVALAILTAKYWKSNKKKMEFIRAMEKAADEARQQKKEHGYTQPPVDESKPINEQTDVLLLHTGLEVADKNLTLDHGHWGEGAFGYVKRGRLRLGDDGSIVVVVKFAKEHTVKNSQLQFANEIKLMQYLPYHSNVLALLGVMSAQMSRGKLGAILEYCEHQSLWTYVYQRSGTSSQVATCSVNMSLLPSIYSRAIERVKEIIPDVHFLFFAYQITRGLAHLISKRIIHGDIALRNILLAERKIGDHKLLVIKVADFGLARSQLDEISDDADRRLPFKWTALEILLGQETGDEASDIWSFAVALWELFAEGEMPYKDIDSSSSLQEYLKQEGRLLKPQKCPQEIYASMRKCWMPQAPSINAKAQQGNLIVDLKHDEERNRRPTFLECQQTFDAFARATHPTEWTQLLYRLDQYSGDATWEIENLKSMIRSQNVEAKRNLLMRDDDEKNMLI